MAYQVYKRTVTRGDAPTIAFVPDGRIAVNAAATRCFMAVSAKAVVLLWDGVNKKIALKAATKGDANAFALSVASDHHSGILRAKTFLAHIGWHGTKRTALAGVWNEKEKMLEVALPDGADATSATRRRET